MRRRGPRTVGSRGSRSSRNPAGWRSLDGRRRRRGERGEPSQGRCPAKADEAALRDGGRENRRELGTGQARNQHPGASGGGRGKKKRGGQPPRAAGRGEPPAMGGGRPATSRQPHQRTPRPGKPGQTDAGAAPERSRAEPRRVTSSRQHGTGTPPCLRIAGAHSRILWLVSEDFGMRWQRFARVFATHDAINL